MSSVPTMGKVRAGRCAGWSWLGRGAAALAVLLLLLASGAAWAERSVTVTYYHTDILGSVYATSDESGNVTSRDPYRPYGAEAGAAPDPAADPEGERHGYAGKQKDASGLIYFGARYYDPTLGRFMGIDPVGVDPANPHSFNRYTYANNNPYKYVDPDGKLPIFFAIPLLLKAVDVGVTAYDTYQAYRSEGVEGAAKELATAAVASVIPGLSTVKKAVKQTANWKSVKQFGHTFSEHGAGKKNTRRLIDRARGTGNPQGQWLNNEAAADFLNNLPVDGPATVRIPTGLGQVITPNGNIVDAEWTRIIPKQEGIRTAFPVISKRKGENHAD